jgi:hypothetical protein
MREPERKPAGECQSPKCRQMARASVDFLHGDPDRHVARYYMNLCEGHHAEFDKDAAKFIERHHIKLPPLTAN